MMPCRVNKKNHAENQKKFWGKAGLQLVERYDYSGARSNDHIVHSEAVRLCMQIRFIVPKVTC